jgi:4-amino-4-deoxy-L-arabinose transferase-like glycosyltransferase
MIVLAFATAAAYWFWRAMEEPPGRGARVLFYVALALALYAKGPLGLLPFLVGAIWLWSQRGPRALTRLWHPLGFLLFVGITLTWVVPFLLLGTGTYAHTVLWQDWLLLAWDAVPRASPMPSVSSRPGILLIPLRCGGRPRAWNLTVAYALSWVVPLGIVLVGALPHPLLARFGASRLIAWWPMSMRPNERRAARHRVGG